MTHCSNALYRAVTICLLLLALSAVGLAQTRGVLSNWTFLPDPQAKYSVKDLPDGEQWRPVLVDRSWNAQFDDLRDYMGVGWYRASFEAPKFESARRVLVRFGAVDYLAEVYVNGRSVCQHEGGYTPFTCDASVMTRAGTNEVIVRVVDPPMKERSGASRFPDTAYDDIPHGKQNWYVQTGGIWQPVELLFRPATYLEQVHVTPDIDGNVVIDVRLAGQSQIGRIAYIIRDKAGSAVASGSAEAANGRARANAHVAQPELWSTTSPALYTVEVTLNDGQDVRRNRVGFRTFEARDGKLFLNGEAFYMMAALDQDFYPETIYSPPSKDYIRDQMLKGKRLGLNTVRCHIKVCDPNYLDAADEMGMLVWYEIPSWNDGHHFTTRAARRGEQIFSEMVDRDWNHPSIVMQSIINESWGADLNQADQRAWLSSAFERAKNITAPLGRLIVDNSACCGNFHLKSDLDDFHQYYSIPDNAAKWDKWITEFASRPKWTFSSFGDAQRTGDEPLIVSEFGNWGLPKLPKSLPWWFGREFDGQEVTRPSAVLNRFHQYNYDRLFTNFNDLAEATQWHQFESLKYEIEAMRRHGSIQGYVITEFTDINWEANGLMDMWRNPKVYADRLAQIQKPDVVLATFERRNYASGETIRLEITASHYDRSDWAGARLRWATQSGIMGETLVTEPPASGEVGRLAVVSVPTPNVNRARKEWISIEVVAANGVRLCDNLYEVFVYPASTKSRAKLRIAIHDPSNSLESLSAALGESGYELGKEQDDVLLISPVFDTAVERHLRSGGRVLLLLNSADALPSGSTVHIKKREGSDLDGNWVSNFNWVRTDAAPFRQLAFGKLLGFEAAEVTPGYVLQNVPSEAYDDVLAGVFYGWLNKNGALALQARYGSGAVLATTFDFTAAYRGDPYARQLLNAMIAYVSGHEFAPKFVWLAESSQLSPG